MAPRIPFTFNAMVLVPLLRSLPVSGAVSVVATLVAMTGLDFGLMGLGHPETAADDVVAWVMSFSVAVPVIWGAYMLINLWKWADGLLRQWRGQQH
jgi:ABC-type dipeptide/oligopeptide/nickel transport system permease component